MSPEIMHEWETRMEGEKRKEASISLKDAEKERKGKIKADIFSQIRRITRS